MDDDKDSLGSHSNFLDRIRYLLLLLLGAEMIGVGAELLLISHWEDGWQLTPLVVLTVGLIALCGHLTFRNRTSLSAFQLGMFVFLLSGVLGVWLHYDSRVEFRLELDPTLAGWKLFRTAMTGSSTPPVLAAGVMAQMGCMGLVSVYRQPLVAKQRGA